MNNEQIQTTSFRSKSAKIMGSAGYLPSEVVKNQDIVKDNPDLFDTIVKRAVGAVERRAASEKETNSEMMARVAEEILRTSGVKATQLSRIICSADPQDRIAPNTASIVQARLGASCPSFDVQMSCAGWLCGVDIALRCLADESEQAYILVMASATVGSRLNFYNRQNRAIFGDGAAGILLGVGQPDRRLICTQLWTDGRFHNDITAPFPWSPHPPSVPAVYQGSFYMSPDQELFFSALSNVLPKFFDRLLAKADISISKIDHFLLHQPSMPLYNHSIKILPQIPKQKIFNSYHKYGNLVAAEMPMMLNDGVADGRIKPGDTIAMLTYGAGFTMAGCIFQY